MTSPMTDRGRASRTRPGPARRTRRLVLIGLVALTTLGLTGTHARAEPGGVDDIEERLDQLWNQAEPLIEQYNEVHESYQRNLARQKQLAAKIAPLKRELELARARVGAIAARAYQSGQADAFNSVLTAGSPTQLADRLTYLDALARDQSNQVADEAELKREYDRQKAPLDTLVVELERQDKELAQRRATIEDHLDEMQRLRVVAYGEAGITGGAYRPSICPSEYLPTRGYQAAAFACNETGKPYVFAAAGPSSYDCSGLTLAAWREAGVYLPHNAAAQRRSMPYITREDLQIGDLVFYFSDLHHVAIYVGNGLVVHAPHAGDRVRMAPIDRNPVHSFGRPSG